MFSRSISLSVLALAASAVVFTGCAADTGSDDESEDLVQSAEALSQESGVDGDPVEDGVVTDGDADEAAADASERFAQAPGPVEIGCGLRGTLRARIKAHFDVNNDGKLDAAERGEVRDFIGGHPRAKLALVKIGIRARHHVWKRVVWAYDADNSGSLDATEREALRDAVQARCEARKARALANWDTDNDGKLDDGELRAAFQARVQARIGNLRQLFGRIDTNDDGMIDAAEGAAARAALKAHYIAKRDAVKAKFDVNADGKLDDAEIAALKAAIRARFETTPPAE